VTIGRVLTNTFAGIDPSSVPAFIGCQLVGGVLAMLLIRALYPDASTVAADVIVPHREDGT
jgi:arsenate reductase